MINKLRRGVVFGGLILAADMALAKGRKRLGVDDPAGMAPKTHLDVAYSDASPGANLMDIYLPEAAGPVPLVVWVHGGGFMAGDKRDGEALPRCLPGLLEAGIGVAAINYRLSGEAIWPAQREDLQAVFAFLRLRGAEYGVDPLRLSVFGASAGATLALHAGFDEAEAGLKAVAAWYPATLFTEMDEDLSLDGPLDKGQSKERRGSSISRLFGRNLDRDPGPALRASPITRLGEVPAGVVLPPFLLAAGEEDETISWRQSKRMVEALTARAVAPEVEFHLYPASGHGSGAFEAEAVGDVQRFLIRWLTEG